MVLLRQESLQKSGVTVSVGAVKTETEGTDTKTGTGMAVNGGSTDLTPEITGVIGPVGLEMIVITGRLGMTGQEMTDHDPEKIHVVKTRLKGPGLRSFCPGLHRQGLCTYCMLSTVDILGFGMNTNFDHVVPVAISCQT